MDLHPTPDQDEIAQSARDFLSRELPADRAPKLAETSLTSGEWSRLAQMGWFGMGLPEEAGGLGLSVVEEALVVREFGRHLVPLQGLATLLAGNLAVILDDSELAAALAGGVLRAAIAIPLGGSGSGEPWAGSYRLVDTGRVDVVIGWSAAGAFLARHDAFTGVETARGLDTSIEMQTARGLDVARALWTDDANGAFHARARVLTAAALTGGAEAVRDLSAEYAKVRHQFGKPIGAFQAIAHPCADMAVRCEAALAATFYASVCVRDDLPMSALYSACARAVALRASYENASGSMQVHGGYGQTYEYLPHFYLKRALIYGLTGGGEEADDATVWGAGSLLRD